MYFFLTFVHFTILTTGCDSQQDATDAGVKTIAQYGEQDGKIGPPDDIKPPNGNIGPNDNVRPPNGEFKNKEMESPQKAVAMVSVEPGSFDMGSDKSDTQRYDDEVLHKVTLTNKYEISETKITKRQFEDLMHYNPVEVFKRCSDCPVQNISWHEAVAFANELSKREGLEQCFTCSGNQSSVKCSVKVHPYKCSGYRLPTEAEWEYAARANTATNYPGSNDIDEAGWWYQNARRETHPVGTKAKNQFGLYGMAGNAREFVLDWYSEYPKGEVIDPFVAPTEGTRPIERGGSYECAAKHLRPSTRYMHMNAKIPHPYMNKVEEDKMEGRQEDEVVYRDVHVGFRVAKTASKQSNN